MNEQVLSWVLTVVGLTGFFLAGNKVWWAWYINIANQIVWVTYAIVAQEFAFLIGAGVYTVFFTRNAIKWTKEHRERIKSFDGLIKYADPIGRVEGVEETENGLKVNFKLNSDDLVSQLKRTSDRVLSIYGDGSLRGVNTDENELVDIDLDNPCSATVEYEGSMFRCHRFSHPTKLDHSAIIFGVRKGSKLNRQILWDESGVYAELEL